MIREAYSHLVEDQHTNPADVLSMGVIVASFMDYVPHATAVLSLIWIALRIWETETIKKITGRWKDD